MNSDKLDSEKLNELEQEERNDERFKFLWSLLGVGSAIGPPVLGYLVTRSVLWGIILGYGAILLPAILVNLLVMVIHAVVDTRGAVSSFRQQGISANQMKTITGLLGYVFNRKVRQRVYQPGYSEIWQDYAEVRKQCHNGWAHLLTASCFTWRFLFLFSCCFLYTLSDLFPKLSVRAK